MLRDRRVEGLGLEDPGALAGFLAPRRALSEPEPADGHRMHRALRDLLAALAAGAPLLLWLDDAHWLDPASAAALAALLRRLPAGAVLVAAAARAGQAPAPVAAAAAAALREGTLERLAPAPLDEAQAAALVGPAAEAIYADSGGNPFYLEQLARAHGAGATVHLDGVPDRVAGALASELDAVSPGARVLLDAAAVAGDPFDPELAAAVAELDDGAATAAVDELVVGTLIRPAAAGVSTPTAARRRRWPRAAPARSPAPATSSTRHGPATRRRSRFSATPPPNSRPVRPRRRPGSGRRRCGCCPPPTPSAACACRSRWPTRRARR